MDIDAMLAMAGDFGAYQVFLMALFSYVNVVSAFHYFSQTFISVTPPHWCASAAVGPASLGAARRFLRPLGDVSCSKYSWNDSELDGRWFLEDPLARVQGNWTAVKCDKWEYDRDNGFESIVSELGWVCDDDWKPVLGQSLFFVGSCVGTLALGVLSDRAGRLPALCAAHALALLGNLATLLAQDLPVFAACRFLSGLATDTNFVMMYIIVMEYMRPSMRTFGLNLCIGVFYCLGCVAAPLLAIALGNWRTYLLVTTLPISLVLGFYFVSVFLLAWIYHAHGREINNQYTPLDQLIGEYITSLLGNWKLSVQVCGLL